jgi:hypothetical protein
MRTPVLQHPLPWIQFRITWMLQTSKVTSSTQAFAGT